MATADLIEQVLDQPTPPSAGNARDVLVGLQAEMRSWGTERLDFSGESLQRLLAQSIRLLGAGDGRQGVWTELRWTVVQFLDRASADDIVASIELLKPHFAHLSNYIRKHPGGTSGDPGWAARTVQARMVAHEARTVEDAFDGLFRGGTRGTPPDDESIERLKEVLARVADEWDAYFLPIFRAQFTTPSSVLTSARGALLSLIRKIASGALSVRDTPQAREGTVPTPWLELQVRVVEFIERITADGEGRVAERFRDAIASEFGTLLDSLLDTHTQECARRLPLAVREDALNRVNELKNRISGVAGTM